MLHVTVCTPAERQHDPFLGALLASARSRGFSSVLAGHRRLWTRYFNAYKIFLLDDLLKHVPDEEIVLFTDAFDVCFINDASPARVEERFRSFHAPVVFSAESNCYPSELAARYPATHATYPYLNSGCFVGYAWALRAICDDLTHPVSWGTLRFCDQNTYSRHYLNTHDRIVLDSEAVLFQSALVLDDIECTPERIRNRVTGTEPLLLHMNGDKQLLERLRAPDDDVSRAVQAHIALRGFREAPFDPDALAPYDPARRGTSGDPQLTRFLAPFRAAPFRLPAWFSPELQTGDVGLDGHLAQILLMLGRRRVGFLLKNGVKRFAERRRLPNRSQ